MSIVVIGVSHRTGSLPLLERLAIRPDEQGKAIAGLVTRHNVREAVVLSTCNRTEIYAVAERFHGAYADIRDFLCELGSISADQTEKVLFPAGTLLVQIGGPGMRIGMGGGAASSMACLMASSSVAADAGQVLE